MRTTKKLKIYIKLLSTFQTFSFTGICLDNVEREETAIKFNILQD